MSLNQIELGWVRVLCKIAESQDGSIQNGRIQNGCHHQVNEIELVWVRVRVEWECFWVNLREDNKVSETRWQCLNPTLQNSRWLPSSSWVRMNEWIFFYVQIGPIQDYRIQDGCHHQVEWEWMSLSQIKLVWVRVRLEWEFFWVNLRKDTKVSESKVALSESNMAEFKMAAIIKLIQNEWVWVRLN